MPSTRSTPVTFRATIEDRARLDELQDRTGLSLADLLRQGLDLIEREANDRDAAYSAGYAKGKAEWEGVLRLLCPKCRDPAKPMVFSYYGNAEHQRAVIEGLERRGYAHVSCAPH